LPKAKLAIIPCITLEIKRSMNKMNNDNMKNRPTLMSASQNDMGPSRQRIYSG
jgi:hypothetical protein